MSPTILLSGQQTFSNRGCEAIVRSTARLLRQQFGEAEIVVPSSDISRDRAQWPDAEKSGVRFVPAVVPWYTRFWLHAQRLPLPTLKRMGWPFAQPKGFRDIIDGVDAVLSVGGDTYSLDYNLPTFFMGMDSTAMDAGKPVVLWGASVGPFEKEPAFLPVIRKHLARMSLITARESVTFEYLNKMGLTNVISVTDPAFTLLPEEVDVTPFWPKDNGAGVLGLNVSSFVERCRTTAESRDRVPEEIADFVQCAVRDFGLGVILVPHVMSRGAASQGDDACYLDGIFARTTDMEGRVTVMDSTLNATQIKHVIGKCRFFVGARTHATIAALSSLVPTISIAYSVKAKGINLDLFGHLNYVLDSPSLSAITLRKSLSRLTTDETNIRTLLRQRMPLWRTRAEQGAVWLANNL